MGKGDGTDFVPTAVIMVMVRRESRNDSDTKSVRRLFHLDGVYGSTAAASFAVSSTIRYE
jgi:hypothetical protein